VNRQKGTNENIQRHADENGSDFSLLLNIQVVCVNICIPQNTTISQAARKSELKLPNLKVRQVHVLK